MPKKEKGSQAAQSDKDIDENIKARFSAQEKRLDVQKSYYDKFKKVLTMRQVQQLYERPDMGSRPRFQGQKPHSAPRRRKAGRRLENRLPQNGKSISGD